MDLRFASDRKRAGQISAKNTALEGAENFLLRVSALEHGRKFGNFLLHDLAALELDGGARRDLELAARDIRIASNTFLRQLYLENAEVAQLHGVPVCKTAGDVVERLLYDIKYLVLHQTSFIADFYHEIPFR